MKTGHEEERPTCIVGSLPTIKRSKARAAKLSAAYVDLRRQPHVPDFFKHATEIRFRGEAHISTNLKNVSHENSVLVH
jgi:hypothetical protein